MAFGQLVTDYITAGFPIGKGACPFEDVALLRINKCLRFVFLGIGEAYTLRFPLLRCYRARDNDSRNCYRLYPQKNG